MSCEPKPEAVTSPPTSSAATPPPTARPAPPTATKPPTSDAPTPPATARSEPPTASEVETTAAAPSTTGRTTIATTAAPQEVPQAPPATEPLPPSTDSHQTTPPQSCTHPTSPAQIWVEADPTWPWLQNVFVQYCGGYGLGDIWGNLWCDTAAPDDAVFPADEIPSFHDDGEDRSGEHPYGPDFAAQMWSTEESVPIGDELTVGRSYRCFVETFSEDGQTPYGRIFSEPFTPTVAAP